MPTTQPPIPKPISARNRVQPGMRVTPGRIAWKGSVSRPGTACSARSPAKRSALLTGTASSTPPACPTRSSSACPPLPTCAGPATSTPTAGPTMWTQGRCVWTTARAGVFVGPRVKPPRIAPMTTSARRVPTSPAPRCLSARFRRESAPANSGT